MEDCDKSLYLAFQTIHSDEVTSGLMRNDFYYDTYLPAFKRVHSWMGPVALYNLRQKSGGADKVEDEVMESVGVWARKGLQSGYKAAKMFLESEETSV